MERCSSFINLEEEDEGVEFNIDDIIDKYKKRQGASASPDSEYIISKDKKILVLFIKPDFMPTEVDKTGVLINKIKNIIKKIDVKNHDKDIGISFAGTYVLSYDQKKCYLQRYGYNFNYRFCFYFYCYFVFY